MSVIAVLLSWALLLAQAVSPSPLVGRWDAETRSNGGLGIWFELGDQGACSQTVGVMLDGTWSLDGQWVTLSVPVPSGPPAVQRGSVTFDGPMLTQAFEGTPKQMLRDGPVPATPTLVGVWTTRTLPAEPHTRNTQQTGARCSGCPSRPRVADGPRMLIVSC